MPEIKLRTGPGVYEVLAYASGGTLEAFKQFVENAADAIQEHGRDDGVIHIELLREAGTGRRGRTRLKSIIVRDNGVGMSAQKMQKVAKSIGDSEKLQLALRGEKGIGILAFAVICERVHIASYAGEEEQGNCLVLAREWLRQERAEILDDCAAHRLRTQGTHVYLYDILPEAAERLTKENIKKFLGREFSQDLINNSFGIQIRDGPRYEPVEPKRFRGVSIMRQPLRVDGDNAYVELYALPRAADDAHVSLLGRAGSRICHLAALDDFQHEPWQDRRLEGFIKYDKLRRTAAKTGVVEDKHYVALSAKLAEIEPEVKDKLDSIGTEERQKELRDILSRVRELVSELAQRLALSQFTEALVEAAGTTQLAGETDPFDRAPGGRRRGRGRGRPTLAIGDRQPNGEKPLKRISTPQLVPTVPPEDKRGVRSWYDDIERIIYVNEEHPDFLEAREDQPRFARYLTHVWIKEAMLQQYATNSPRLSDEMVGVISQAEALFAKYF